MKKLLIGVGIVLAVLLGFLIWIGLFDKPTISEVDAGPYTFVFKRYQAEYQMSTISLNYLSNYLIEKGFHPKRNFSFYFDDPQEMGERILRSIAGYILEPEDADKVDTIKEDFWVKEFKVQKCIQATFPYRDRLALLFAYFRTYPAMEQLRTDRNYAKGPVLEIYDLPNKKIIYLMPINPTVRYMKEFYYVESRNAGTAAAVTPTAQPAEAQPAATAVPAK